MFMINKMSETYSDYLRDESRSVGSADAICFPGNENEVITAVRYAHDHRLKIFVQGARTGVAAGAVPRGGLIINMSRMNQILGLRRGTDHCLYLRVQPGVLLSQLNRMLEKLDFQIDHWDTESIDCLKQMQPAAWIFPPDPTETTAAIGGMAACNASGAKTYHYGPTRNYVHGLRVVLPDGDTLSLSRGRIQERNGCIRLVTDGGRDICAPIPGYESPDVKSAAGYYIRSGMDAVDLFIGSEGTLGIFTELELKLVPAPNIRFGVLSFFDTAETAITYVRGLRGEGSCCAGQLLEPLAIEYFDCRLLDLLRIQQKTNPAFTQIQPIPDGEQTAVYTEFAADDKEMVWEIAGCLGDLLTGIGGNIHNTWAALDAAQMEKLRYFRHACPECVNIQIDNVRKQDSRITKLGTDMSVKSEDLEWVVQMYERDLEAAGLNFVKFGHIGQNHLHVNVVPRNMQEYEQAKALYLRWAEQISRKGGSVAAEHGIGKLKVPFLRTMLGDQILQQMAELKRAFDPGFVLNAGNIVPIPERGDCG